MNKKQLVSNDSIENTFNNINSQRVLRPLKNINYAEEDANFDDIKDLDYNPEDDDYDQDDDDSDNDYAYSDNEDDEMEHNYKYNNKNMVNVCKRRFENGKVVYRWVKMTKDEAEMENDPDYELEEN